VAGHATYPSADAAAEPDDLGVDPPESQIPEEIPEYEPIDDEMSELLDLGTPSDPEAGAIGQIKDLYEVAETVSQASLDRHFDQLLEKQRKLISEYFNESTGLTPPDAVAAVAPVGSSAAADPADPAAPFGFDTAESLASLRGDLRGAP
jgi:hypothetical protein